MTSSPPSTVSGATEPKLTGNPAGAPATATHPPAPQGASEVVERLGALAREQERLQEQLAALRDERDALILSGLAQGLSSAELANTAHLTGARVRAIADAAAASSARERVSRAIAKLAEQTPALCTTYGALATAVGIGSAKGVASSLAANPDVSSREGARVLLLRWASPTLVGYVIPTSEPTWQTQGDDTASRLDCLKADNLVVETPGPTGPVWVVPFERVCADATRLTRLITS